MAVSIVEQIRGSLQHVMPCNKAASDVQIRPRPGIYYGRYPARQVEHKGKLTEVLESLTHQIKVRLPANSDRVDAFVAAVKERDNIIRDMADGVLDAWITNIKKRLHQQGLSESNIVLAFAAIREVSRRELSMAHFDCQISAGYVMMQDKIAEMQTGEGKTLTATLPVACAAMAGIPVHLITANDYLVERDHELMRPVYARLGLSSGTILTDTDDDHRRKVYASDITYCTAQQLVFDYLKDRILRRQFENDTRLRLAPLYASADLEQHLLLRGLNFAIIDEADSVLIDEARTPLILSRQSNNTLQESVNREAVWLARQLDRDLHFVSDRNQRSIEITKQGHSKLETLTADMYGIWQGERHRTSLVSQALSALYNFKRDIDYVVIDGKINIIDENTGRMMPDRRWEAGLHQMIEEKEGCEQSGLNETVARISFQRFFARYHRLAGMTGTAREVRGELYNVYGLNTATIATNKPSRRKNEGEIVYLNREDKWQAIADCAEKHSHNGRPVLIGTRTLEDSETVSEYLTARNLQHTVLNAKQNSNEADIISRAGKSGQITVATNMAGRGTDIPLTDESIQAGGLHVICCEKNLSSRIDRQLFGRCARQGDPGSYQTILSLEDEIVGSHLSSVSGLIKTLSSNSVTAKPQRLTRLLIGIAQRLSETRYRRLRKLMTRADEKRDAMMAFSGKSE